MLSTYVVEFHIRGGPKQWIDGVDNAALKAIGPASAFLTSLALYSLLVLWLASILALAALPPEGG